MTAILVLIASASTATFVLTALVLYRRPMRRLAGRVRPYAAPGLSALGQPVVAPPVARRAGQPATWRQRLAGTLHGGRSDPQLEARLAQSGLYQGTPGQMVGEYRVRQLLFAAGGGALGVGVGASVGLAPLASLAVGLLAGATQVLRPTGAVDRAIDHRRQQLRAAIPPLCQLLAMRLRATGSVVVSLSATLERTQGDLADELREALAQHRAGQPLEAALDAVARTTPEPEAARVHRLLASAIRHGIDAAPELLRLARDARANQLTRLRREATAKRAAILLPIIGLLAPLMLLFIAAPLPGLLGL
ncbi:type II secretion system F family protein [Euzebya tangerina]|uniref:type II secretion system F family protein n=1 Tax=Euzebya tangerina TaxID=591198 RepID=UPI000E31E956|nr:type II secretion system F family protein [Euzebya tangerina]